MVIRRDRARHEANRAAAEPSSIEEMQAASAVGQGTLFRAANPFLSAGAHLQVLLTSFDLAVRMHY